VIHCGDCAKTRYEQNSGNWDDFRPWLFFLNRGTYCTPRMLETVSMI